MEKCIVTLKNVKTFRGTEGHGLNADVYVNGKKCCLIMDAADGGEYRYEEYDKKLFKEFQDYAKAQPKYQMEFDGVPYLKDGKPVMMDVTIDQLIDAEFDRMEKAKEAKKLEKKFENHVYGACQTHHLTLKLSSHTLCPNIQRTSCRKQSTSTRKTSSRVKFSGIQISRHWELTLNQLTKINHNEKVHLNEHRPVGRYHIQCADMVCVRGRSDVPCQSAARIQRQSLHHRLFTL